MASTPDSFQNCLCLVCRRTGHIVEGCSLYMQWLRENINSTPPRDKPIYPTPPFNPLPTLDPAQALCERCSQLDGLVEIATLMPFVLDDRSDNHSKRATKKTTQLPSLGPVLSLRLLSTCPLCRLLFDITRMKDEDIDLVHSSGAELVLIVAWTVHRLEEALYWHGCGMGKGPYAKCVYTSVKKEWEDGTLCAPVNLVEDALDALVLVDIGEGLLSDEPALSVRGVDPKTPDYSIIRAWLRRCDDFHRIVCRPMVSERLKQIKLVHVETRQVVMYPADGCDYVAVSYVWGGVQQPSYKVGDILPTVPATLEDTMIVVRNLGKGYLWADSLCIDQGNDEEKAVQIALMSTIYSGAWATIICLSSGSARNGIHRVGALESVPQISCEIRGKRLLSTMPTLFQQISWSPWGSRAWTFQEGILSPRRLFFTNHQVYFECNSVQCCESLVDSNSPFHLLSDGKRQKDLQDAVFDPGESKKVEPEEIIGRGVLRDPFRPISRVEEAQVDDRFETYLNLVSEYTTRKMTQDADSLNAFSAILARLERDRYREGFVQGLPVEDLPRALLWFHHAPPRRRVGFPAWSWAGWEGGVSHEIIDGAKDVCEELMPPLRVWKAGRDEPVYKFSPIRHIISAPEEPPKSDDDEDAISDNTDSSHSDAEPGYESDDVDEELSEQSSVEEIRFENDLVPYISKEEIPWVLAEIKWNELRIEGIVIRLSFAENLEDHSDSDSETDDKYDTRCSVRIQGHPEPQQLKFYGHNAKQLVSERSNKQQEFLLVSREDIQHKIYNALLLVDLDGVEAQRVGVASLRLDSVELLENLEPERKLFKLG